MADILANNPEAGASSLPLESDPAATPYVHQELPGAVGDRWIRIFKIQPSENFSAPIKCTLQQVCLDDRPAYETISYIWGDPALTSSIYIDGKILTIPQSLAEVLSYIRTSDSELSIWADAICINQLSDSEKNHQVTLMRDIYSISSKTKAYLGGGIDYANFVKMTDTITEGRLKMEEARDMRFALMHTPRDVIDYGLPLVSSPDLLRWLQVFESPFFRRIWTVQEVSCAFRIDVVIPAEKVFHTMPWDRLVEGYKAAVEFYYFPLTGVDSHHMHQLEAYRYKVQRPRRHRMPTRLLPVLAASRACGASNDVDKVYALVSLRSMHSLVNITYGPSMTVVDVYRDTAIAILQQERNLDLFGIMRPKETKYPDLPSWVPDWSNSAIPSPTLQGTEFENLGESLMATLDCTATGSNSQYMLKLDRENRCLVVSGFTTATVDVAHSIWYEWADTGDLAARSQAEAVRQLSEKFKTLESVYRAFGFSEQQSKKKVYSATGESFYDVFGLTIQTGRGGFSGVFDRFQEICKTQKKFLKAYETANRREAKWGSAATWIWNLSSRWNKWDKYEGNSLSGFERAIATFHTDRVLIQLSDGMIGAAPQLTRPGDKVALIQGAKVPIILREKDNDEWEVIGEAYVHGLMNGEHWVESKAKEMLLC